MAQLAINMDQNKQILSPLMSEPAYFDGMYRRCEWWKTLTLWLYHSSSTRLYRIATMEVKGETSENIAQFWRLLNQMLAEIQNIPDYKFNPACFYTDEAGAIYNGITTVYGNAGGAKKYNTCHWHFKHHMEEMLSKFPPELTELRTEFESLVLQLLYVPTSSEYHELASRIKIIAALVKGVETQVNWWFARKYNLFPIFRGFCLTSLNMAEIGHSTLKKKKPLALVDAAWEDVYTAILQEQEHTAFLAGRVRSSGKGPTTTQLSDQMKRSRSYQQAFKEGRLSVVEAD